MSNFLIIIVSVIIIGIYIYFQFFQKKEKVQRYELRSDFFNRSEFAFYQLLEEKIPKNFMIFSKTRIEDFIRVKAGFGTNETWGLRSRIKSRHVDFLICNEYGKPRLAIEIDGGSHDNFDRKNRDNFIDELYNEVGLDIIHIKVGENFEQRINEIIQKI